MGWAGVCPPGDSHRQCWVDVRVPDCLEQTVPCFATPAAPAAPPPQVTAAITYLRSENMCYPACTNKVDGGRQCNKKLQDNGDGTWWVAPSQRLRFRGCRGAGMPQREGCQGLA